MYRYALTVILGKLIFFVNVVLGVIFRVLGIFLLIFVGNYNRQKPACFAKAVHLHSCKRFFPRTDIENSTFLPSTIL